MSLQQRLAELEREGRAVAVATVIRTRGSVPRRAGSKMLIYPKGGIEGTIGGGEMERLVIEAAVQSLEDGEHRVLHYAFRDPERGDPGVCGGEMEVFVEPIRPKPTLVVVGGGHVGNAVAYLASWLDFRVVVCDDRPEFATAEAVPQADQFIHCDLAELPERTQIDEHTYVLLTTRGVPLDVAGLPALLKTKAAYIGVIGSKRRWETTAKEVKEKGIAKSQIAKVTSPMGLELNAETPQEIALSILAEIIMLRRGGTGEPMAHAVKPRRGRKGA
ncbi:MAG: XdhC family protein [Anaerolineales bacterium]|jgi:xanthine dehydrogenase accessory factor